MRDPLVRFMEKIERDASGCWLWRGKVHRSGYGVFSVGHARSQFAHRWIYQHERGPVPAGLELDHLCRVRHCVNPAHLEAVTRRENLLRGQTIPAAHAAKTRCPQGHPYDEGNTYRFRGSRQCRTCRAVRSAERRAALTRRTMAL